MYVSMHIKGMIQDRKTSESLAFQEYQDVQDMACQGKQGERGALKMHTHPNKTYHSYGL